ncbi:P-loop containing nucleoside triphosphate hydrolase protein [Lipomyces tetrasporus]|uniref:P-loop containing nucleoside triphosphate hydrolase protein n=1 Tax=Lipomyces tetrasporus TaxID=54092 RepID=A0AAD7VTM9_9ASCO|nr:P-loop containing nucleoside triphosphate hydrolase protein [Lipomyces tetrasporus]KAJ8100914.1 P-loop containing nucleoside triphosphate hydrolase protein [Lipomyces tetrasporus]
MDESEYKEKAYSASEDITEHDPPSSEGCDLSAVLTSPTIEQCGPKLSFNEVETVDISVRNLTVTITPATVVRIPGIRRKKKKLKPDDAEKGWSGVEKKILDDISIDVPSGSVMAIIGGSGSGKTSLLNVLAHRMKSPNLHINGSVIFNGHSNIRKIRHAYVLQQDILLPSLTCRETLIYSADLRLPSSTTKDERRQLVEEVILELGLKECADTIVGDNEHKGLSGGEKRRLSLGIQLLSNPSVLFLDEPTTGLDSYSAQLLIKTLQKLSRRGRTLILSIHQPRSDIFFLFDSITLLSQGQPVYSGKAKDSMTYFSRLGYTVPEHMNPADYLIDIVAYDTRSAKLEDESRTRIRLLVTVWRREQNFERVRISHEPPSLKNKRAPLWREIVVLTERTFKITYRDTLGLVAGTLEAIFMGIMCGLVFYNLDGSLLGIRSMMGALYSANALQGYLILMYETYRLCEIDMKVFDRERKDGMVGVAGFLLSRRLARLATEDVICPFLFAAISYFMIGLRTSAHHFFIYFLNVLLQQWVSVCVATLCAAISRDYPQSSLIANMVYTVQSMACGYFNQASTMPVYVRWMRWIAYVYFGFGAVTSNQFTDYFGDCPYGRESNPECIQYTGSYQLSSLGFPQHWIAVPLIAVLCFAVGSYLIAGLILTYIPIDVSAATSTRKQDTLKSVSMDVDSGWESQKKQRPVSVDITGLKLGIKKRNIYLMTRRIDILHNVTAHFEPGKINAILGPSGSGKSSLLNYIALRLHSSVFSHYFSSGSVLFGGQDPSPSVLKSICSYVTQDDDGLLPSLTVRETLQFAADLRLPPHLSKEQKRARVEEVILKMGLKDCADTPIGSELVKGISGGEKRRVSISVQLLNEPKILLLDEPTSGLDSFTAASILTVLKGLADEGRTIVCTIHQPRSDLFSFFGNILLLAKGGRVAYTGPGNNAVLKYFADCGHTCPPLTNPTDHILDLISVNLQDPTSEIVTRKRVNKLLERFEEKSRSQKLLTTKGEILLAAELGSLGRDRAPFFRAMPILVRRGYLDMIRRPAIIAARFGQVVGFGAILALFFAPLKHDYYGSVNRLGIIQQCCALYFVGMLNNIAVYPEQRDIFYREHDDGVYGVLPFLASYSLFEIPLEMINGLFFAAFVVMVTGLNRTVETFFFTVLAAFVVVNCGESIGIAFNTIFKHSGFAATMTSVVLTIGTLMNGLFSMHMLGFLRALNYVNPLKYTTAVMVNYGFAGLTFGCDDSLRLANGQCPIPTGEVLLETYGYVVPKRLYVGYMLVAMVIYRLLASALLIIMRSQLRIKSGKTVVSDQGN